MYKFAVGTNYFDSELKNRGRFRFISKWLLICGIIPLMTLLCGCISTAMANEATIKEVKGLPSLVAEISPAVVNLSISSTKSVVVSDMLPFGLPSFMLRIFGEGERVVKKQVNAIGSGFFVASDGTIATNYHVVQDADEIMVILQDGREFSAKVIVGDEKTDIALLKINAKESFPFLKFANSDKVLVGEDVIAIGNPFGLGGTVTKGIVSAKSREIGKVVYEDFIQTDAPVNAGSSGGPLLNLKGEVVGIITAGNRYANSEGNIGLNFAISSNLANSIINKLMSDGKIKRPWLGIASAHVNNRIAEAVGLKDMMGLFIMEVVPSSPAEKVGLKVGDVILTYNGHKLIKGVKFNKLFLDTPMGTEAQMEIWRYGKTLSVKVLLSAERPENIDRRDGNVDVLSKSSIVSVVTITPSLCDKIGIRGDLKGVLVNNIISKFVQDNNEIRVGDIIIKCNGANVETAEAFEAFLVNLKKNGKKSAIVEMFPARGGGKAIVPVRFFE